MTDFLPNPNPIHKPHQNKKISTRYLNFYILNLKTRKKNKRLTLKNIKQKTKSLYPTSKTIKIKSSPTFKLKAKLENQKKEIQKMTKAIAKA